MLTRLFVIVCLMLSGLSAVALLSRPGEPVAAQPVATVHIAPATGVVSLQPAQATPAPDYAATAAVAQAAAEYAVGQTATAQAAQQATATAQFGATVQAVTLQWAQVAVQQTQSAMTTTAQAVQAAQATGTHSAGAATQTATAAIPAMTATRAAQVVQAGRDERQWVVVWGLLAFVVIVLGLAAARWVHSRGIVREAQAQAALREASARAYSLEMAAYAQATRVQVSGDKVLVIVNGEITAERQLSAPGGEIVEQPPQHASNGTPAHLQHAAGLVLASMYVRAALAETDRERWPKNRIPRATDFQAANNGRWADMRQWPAEVGALCRTYASAGEWQRAVDAMRVHLRVGSDGTFCNDRELAHLYTRLNQAVAHAPRPAD